jgi:hypothetical protein
VKLDAVSGGDFSGHGVVGSLIVTPSPDSPSSVLCRSARDRFRPSPWST